MFEPQVRLHCILVWHKTRVTLLVVYSVVSYMMYFDLIVYYLYMYHQPHVTLMAYTRTSPCYFVSFLYVVLKNHQWPTISHFASYDSINYIKIISFSLIFMLLSYYRDLVCNYSYGFGSELGICDKIGDQTRLTLKFERNYIEGVA